MNFQPRKDARNKAIEQARYYLSKNPVYLDTETTGIAKTSEIVEITIVDHDGAILFDNLVKPNAPIPREAMQVHHITNEMVANEKTWMVLWPEIRAVLFNRVIGMYNNKFDMRMMQQTMNIYNPKIRIANQTFDIMDLYAKFKGEWDTRRNAYRYQRLEKAGRELNIPIPNSHRAKDDTLLTREVLIKMAETEIEE